MASGGVSAQTLGFLTSANQAIPYESLNRNPVKTSSGGSGSASSFLSTIGSAGSHALDLLSRPMYAVAAGADEAMKQAFQVGTPNSSIGSEILRGIEGKNKMDFVQMMQDYADLRHQEDQNQAASGELKGATAQGVTPGEGYVNPWVKLGVGLTGDIFLDPSTYVGVGLIKDAITAPIKIVRGAVDATKGLEVASDAAKAASVGDNVANSVAEAQKAKDAIEATGATSLDFPGPIGGIEPKVPIKGLTAKAGQKFADTLFGGPPIKAVVDPEETLRVFHGPGGPLHPGRALPEHLNLPSTLRVGKRIFNLKFDDGVTQALYRVRTGIALGEQGNHILDFLKTHFGEDVKSIRQRGKAVYTTVNEMAKKAAPTIDTIHLHDMHMAAISKASQDVIKSHQTQAAARDVADGIHALDTPVEKQQAAISASRAARGDPALHTVIAKTADNAVKGTIPEHISAVDGAGTTLLKDTEEGISAEGQLKNRAILGEAARRTDLGIKYDKTPDRIRDKSFWKHLSHTAGLPNMHRVFANLIDQLRSDIQNEVRIYTTRFSRYSESTQKAAWLALREGLSTDAAPDVVEATKLLASAFNRYIGPNDVFREALNGTTKVTQSGLDMRLLNHYLPYDMKFTAGKVLMKDGRTLDFSAPGAWKDSWKAWETSDPMAAMYHMMSAVNKAQTYKAVFATLPDMLPEGISAVAKQGFVPWERADHLADGMYFDEMHLRELKNWENKVNQLKDWNSPVARVYDKSLNAWKSVVTIYNPVHHFHNAFGDFMLSFMYHPMTALNYKKAAEVLAAQHKLFRGFNPTVRDVEGALSFSDLHSATGLEKALGFTPKPGDIKFRFKLKGKNTLNLDDNQLVTILHQLGVLPHFQTVEDLAAVDDKFKPLFEGPLHGKVSRGLGHFSENREHFERIAFFLEMLKRDGKKFSDPRAALEHAAWQTRFVHPTGQGLTDAERLVMRRMMPFYSWTRNVTPVIAKALTEHPGRAIAYYKFNHALALSQGVPQPDIGQQFPTDQGFPNWIRQEILGPVFGSPGSYEIMDLKDPTSGLFQQAVDPVHAVGGMLTPALQWPGSVIARQNLGSGAPIPSVGSYINQQTPVTNILDRIFNVNLGPGSLIPEQKSKSEGGGVGLPPIQTPVQTRAPANDLTGLFNWLLGTGLLNTGKYAPGVKKASAP